ncbi:MAG: hypothetical protein K8L91_21545 [Anaerolineae bacterium]|nr:hypothetical protein [Anaerolineae bacterium]
MMKLHRYLLTALALTFVGIGGVHAQVDSTTTTTLFMTEDGAFSVQLPEGWYADGDAEWLAVSNNPDVTDPNNLAMMKSGDYLSLVVPVARAAMDTSQIAADATILEIATVLAPTFTNSDSTTVVGEVQSLSDWVARVALADDENDGVVYVADYLAPDYFSVTVMAAVKGELTEEAEAMMLDVLQTVHYSLPLEQTYVVPDNGVTFSYPADWKANENDFGTVIFADSQNTLDNVFAGNDPAPGEFSIYAVPISPGDTPSDLSGEGMQTFLHEFVTKLVSPRDVHPVVGVTIEDTHPVVGEAQLLENEALLGGMIAYVPVTNDISEGGFFLVNDGGVLWIVLFAGAPNEGDQLFGTALGIANSITFTPAE